MCFLFEFSASFSKAHGVKFARAGEQLLVKVQFSRVPDRKSSSWNDLVRPWNWNSFIGNVKPADRKRGPNSDDLIEAEIERRERCLPGLQWDRCQSVHQWEMRVFGVFVNSVDHFLIAFLLPIGMNSHSFNHLWKDDVGVGSGDEGTA